MSKALVLWQVGLTANVKLHFCPIFIIFFLFCSYFQAASIYGKSEARNQSEKNGLNPLVLG